MNQTYQKSNIKYQKQDKKSKMDVKYRAFYLSIDIIRFLEKLSFKTSIKIISDQLIRAITSVGANLVEAKSSSSKKEFLNYFQIALKSANEAKYWLAMLRELLPEEKEKIEDFLDELEQISRIIATSVLTMKGKTKL
ncbi:MAG TPA: four helix bundle protein [Patescibacteria group bacterium]|nr:four helix bundle protein [Patescibacteria group bacterium]